MPTNNERFRIRRGRPGTGLGLYARAVLRKGEFLLEYIGTKIPTALADALTTRYLFEIDERWTIDGSSRENIARYINHACEPNCEAELEGERILINAKRHIAPGEELTLDYGDEYFDEFIKPSGCKCTRCESSNVLR